MKGAWQSGGRSRARLLVFALIAAGLLLASFLPSLGVPYDPYAQDLSMALQPPDGAHWLGTDRYGRDLLARVLLGGQTSIPAALAAAALAAVTGSLRKRRCSVWLIWRWRCRGWCWPWRWRRP